MDKELAKIVSEKHEIDFDLLNQHTAWVDVTQIDTVNWDRVEQLHVVEAKPWDRDKVPPKGVYVSRDATWVLLSCPDGEQLERLLANNWKGLVYFDIMAANQKYLDISGMSNLQVLMCTCYGVDGKPGRIKGIEQCGSIAEIELTGFAPETTWDVSGLTRLKTIYIQPFFRAGTAEHLIAGFQNLAELEVLMLCGAWNRPELDVSFMHSLYALLVTDDPVFCQV